jgi:uncharacterized protein
VTADPRERTAIVDVLRGWALLGVVLVNFTIFYSFYRVQRIPEGDVLSQGAKMIVQVIFQGKGWPALALLFGYGFSAWIEKTRSRGVNPVQGFIRRMLLLLIFGLLNCALYYGDVLKDYAVVGLVILAFYRVSARTALMVGVGCLLAFPALVPFTRSLGIASPVASPDIALYQSHDLLRVLRFGLQSGLNISLSITKYADWNLVMLGCAFIGMYVQRVGLLERLANNLPQIRRIFWCSLSFAIAIAAARAGAERLGLDPDDHYDVRLWPMLGQMSFFMAGICWLYSAGRLRALLDSLRIVGRMTLTNYFVQNVTALLVFSGFGLGLLHRIPYSAHAGIALVLFVAQVYFSRWWLARHRLGPVETAWRTLSRTAGPMEQKPLRQAGGGIQ